MEKKLQKLWGMRRNKRPVQGDQKKFTSVSVEYEREREVMGKGTLKTKWIKTFQDEEL